MNNERRENIHQRVNESFKQDHEQQKARLNNGNRRSSFASNDDNLLCACTGLACEGVCRELHLHRPRFANPTAKKDADVQKSWADKCPEAYKN